MKTVWVLTLVLHCALSENSEVVDPGSPVVAVAGSDVVLPCSVRRSAGQSSLSAVDMNINWTRPDLGDALVHLYANHRDVNTRQIPQYRGRTAVFTEELQNGNVSLRLTDIKLLDEGDYKCRVDSKFWKDEVTINLRVEVIGERPVISVEKYDSNSEQFSLLCESKGWRPQPDLQLLNSKGENQTAGDPEIQRRADLFNVKRRFTVHKNHIDTFYCRATLGEHKEEKEIKPIVFYDLLPMPTGAKVAIGFAVAVIIVLILAGIVYFKYKERKEKEELKRVMRALGTPEEEQPDDSSVMTTLLNHLRNVPLLILRKRLRRLLKSRSGVVLCGKGLTEKSFAVLASALSSQNSKLTELDLSQNTLRNSEVKKLCEGLRSPNCKLQKLSLIDCSFTKETCADLASILSLKNSTLRELDLSKNDLWNSGVKELSEGLKSPDCKLERLGLSECRLTEESCADLASVLMVKNSPLRKLDLSENKLQDSGVKKLCDGLRSENCKLETLNLSDCRLTEESCADLASALMVKNSPLRKLDLSYNTLRDSGVKELCDGLRSENCKLETLKLSSCSITDEGCAELVTALRSNPSYLTELDLDMNPLGASGVEQLIELKDNPGYKLKKLR
uniref:Ig-like domain-containing protein n=1 Tax=Pygocentrus nattereri TaxID=42514 RepID=A0A3B4EIZ3_PYGNA